ncbi:MAG: hypothetical protein A6F72_01220 [Cycloclasticus sp. symbiont of Poecilosclerida sp. N]|nr:MAG: hypothetical protein A6F72_01220 [Cycloclasticus sp. symbiont of Poecilosclerida sp. N]
MSLTIDLLRHGEVAGGLKLRGNVDDPLSDKGWQQMRHVIRGESLPWKQIITSPLQRCALFAEELSLRTVTPLTTHSGFKEISFGDWEGQFVSTLYENHPQDMQDFWNNPEQITPPNGEPYVLFERRIREAWQQLIENNDAENILLVAHGGVIRAIFKIILGLPIQSFFSIDVPHVGLSRIIIEEGTARISFINGQLS